MFFEFYSTYVARRATIFEFATSVCVIFRSFLIVSVNYQTQKSAQLEISDYFHQVTVTKLTKGGKANHDKKATKKPSQENKNTRPYLLNGFKIGTDKALYVRGLISGAAKRRVKALLGIFPLPVGSGGQYKMCE